MAMTPLTYSSKLRASEKLSDLGRYTLSRNAQQKDIADQVHKQVVLGFYLECLTDGFLTIANQTSTILQVNYLCKLNNAYPVL